MSAPETLYDPPLDPLIAQIVHALNAAGVDTFESCQGGPGHCEPEPMVRFHGDAAAGMVALSAAMQAGLPVAELRRQWWVLDGEVTGPYWVMTFKLSPHRRNPAESPLLTYAQREALVNALAMPQDTRDERDARSEAKHRAFSGLVNSDPENSFSHDDIIGWLLESDTRLRGAA
jgi:hypothetical protein